MKKTSRTLFLALVTIATLHGGCSSGGAGGGTDHRADSLDLSGRTYSRTFQAQPLGAPAPSSYKHSVHFVDASNVVDDGSSFFGNPPEYGTYRVQGLTVSMRLHAVSGDYDTSYTLSSDGNSLTNDAGAVLTLEGAATLAGKTFSRSFQGTPLGLSHPVTIKHSVQFVDDTHVVDDGASAFGNPPELGTYVVSGSTITLTLNAVSGEYQSIYTLAADGQSITNDAGAVLTLEVSTLAGKVFSRTFQGTPLGGSGPVTLTQRVEFTDDTHCVDTGATAFGNPPEHGTYSVDGSKITLTLTSVSGEYQTIYTLAADGLSISNDAGAVLTLE